MSLQFLFERINRLKMEAKLFHCLGSCALKHLSPLVLKCVGGNQDTNMLLLSFQKQ